MFCPGSSPQGAPGRRDLGGGGEVAPAATHPGRLQVHQEPRRDDLGHRDPQEPQRDRRGHQEEEGRSAQAASVSQQAEDRPR